MRKNQNLDYKIEAPNFLEWLFHLIGKAVFNLILLQKIAHKKIS